MLTFHVGNIWTTVSFPASEINNIGAILGKYLTVEVPGAKFLWAYKSGEWDGKARLFKLEDDTTSFTFLTGLFPTIQEALVREGYTWSFNDQRNIGTSTPQLAPYTAPLREYQHEVLSKAFSNTIDGVGWFPRGILQVATGGGKCLGKGTPILLYDGSVKPVEAVTVNDTLIGPDSKPRKVKSTCYGKDLMYKIKPIKGDFWVANGPHILVLKNTVTKKTVEISIDDYLKQTKTFKHLHKLYHASGVEWEREEVKHVLSIDPYFIGLWLGDGKKDLNGVIISNPDVEIINYLNRFAEDNGYTVRNYEKRKGFCPSWGLSTKKGKPNPLLTKMRLL